MDDYETYFLDHLEKPDRQMKQLSDLVFVLILWCLALPLVALNWLMGLGKSKE